MKALPSFNHMLEDIGGKKSPISFHGIIDEALGHFIYSIEDKLESSLLLVTYDSAKAKKLYEDLRNFFGDKVYLYSKREPMFFRLDSYSMDIENSRLEVLSKLVGDEAIIVVTTVEALGEKVMSRDIFSQARLSIDYDSEIDPEELARDLVEIGYRREDMVEDKGQFSIRGGIIDIFPRDRDNPYRIELFDTEVDSIRVFDVNSQRSLSNLEEISISPAREFLILEEERQQIVKSIEKELEKSEEKYKDNLDRLRTLEEKFLLVKEELEQSSSLTNIDLIKPFVGEDSSSSLLDYFDRDSYIVLDELARLEESYDRNLEIFHMQVSDLLESGQVFSIHANLILSFRQLIKKLEEKRLLIKNTLVKTIPYFDPLAVYNFSTKTVPVFNKKMDIFLEEIRHLLYRGYKIVILSSSKEQAMRNKEMFLENEILASFSEDYKAEVKSGQLILSLGNLNKGFEYSSNKFIVFTNNEIYGSAREKTRGKKKTKESGLDFSDLSVGDYIVHENHGIGRYLGIEQLNVQGVKKDYLSLSYRGNDKLYVPVDQMNLIKKYIGSEGAKPKLNKLSSQEWVKTKARVQKSIEDMAEELLELYAKRESFKGHAFSKDTVWQGEFEDLFPYEETDSQLRSINEIKEDMELAKPMDRLLCGDVGYGKTEVALRACFKAVMDNKQVAFLVPTTILAQQHYETMKERFKNFPVNIEVLSRFRTKKQQDQAIEGLKMGSVDIVIGTHRILSKDIKFKDLGLLVVDEEQRFGVKHKERLKSIKSNVDVLTLTATPIPRTLHMSLVGIRDMSVLDEPPRERNPIQTYVVEYNEDMIREAILKEIYRQGQVYFVYNRVIDIDKIALSIQKLVPEARLRVAHGQMGEARLEAIMTDFVEGEFDILVSTTIIETGLDIPNVNTIIIYDADKMGLSQLYQLRGRVGRSERLAYAYFTYEKDKVLTEVAEKRLNVIKEFTEFGSGFKIAMRDLQIRGAGNLLGTEQHGHMDAIGYDLYVKFLNQAVKRLKGMEVEEEINASIELDISAYIPDSYIKNEEQKILMYQKINSIKTEEEKDEIVDELIDRYGDLPREVENLLFVSYIKAQAERISVERIYQNNRFIVLEFADFDSVSKEVIAMVSGEYGQRIYFDLSEKMAFKYSYGRKPLDGLLQLIDFIRLSKEELEEGKEV